MTAKNYAKVFTQLESKPAKWAKVQKHNKPKSRPFGRREKSCKLCGSMRAVLGEYGLQICRRCFRDNASNIGFKRLN